MAFTPTRKQIRTILRIAGFRYGSGAKRIDCLKETKANILFRHEYVKYVRGLRGKAHRFRDHPGFMPKPGFPIVVMDESYCNL